MTEQLSFYPPEATAAPKPIQRKTFSGKIIYETKGKAREYRQLSANLYTGCDHQCTYCYAPLVLQRNRVDFHTHVEPRKDILKLLDKDAAGYASVGEMRQVLFCFTCDPYSPAIHNTRVTRNAIQILHKHGLHVCTLTKGGTRAVRDLDMFTPQDTFATTLTCLDDKTSLEWEPGAALPGDRITALQRFHDAGIPTWVSLEPVLDPETVYQIIRVTAPFVDEFKVGVLNYHKRAGEINWREFGLKAINLLEKLGKRYYIKEDLAKLLG